ncbi:MAG: DUF3343 domain-containing protein [Candidatus Avoscillospira sp.]
MNDYAATFHTHLSALLTCRALTNAGIPARMAPVPRKLSSSCGTCVFYTAPEPCRDCLDQDTERVYRVDGDGYRMVLDLEA